MDRADADERGASAAPEELTDNEGAVLALILLREPITAYQIVRVHELSPSSNFNESKGSVYPIISRLKKRGYVEGTRTAGDGRNSEHLTCSRAGREAVRRWVLHIRPNHILISDPLRTKSMSLTTLSRDEQIEWIGRLKGMVAAKIEEVETYSRTMVVPYNDVVHGNAMISLHGRIQWLDAMLHRIRTGDN